MPVDHRCGGLGLHHGQIFAAAQRGLGGGIVGVAHCGILGPVGDGVLHGGLHLGIQGGVDDVAAVAQLGLHAAAVGGGVLQALDAQHLGHNVVDGVLHVVGVVVHGVGGGRGGLQHVELLGLGSVALLLGDQALVEHLLEHVVGALVDQLGALVDVVISAGVVAVGVADDGRDAGALAQGQLAQILAEVVLGRDLHAVVRAAEVDYVQVGLQDLLLGQLLLHLKRQIGLLHLALVVLVGIEQRQLDQLAGDGGRALQAAAHDVVKHRAGHALDVHAVVLPEACVLDGDDRVDQLLGNVLVVHVDAVLRTLEVGDEVAVLVVDEGGEGLRADLFDVQLRAGVHPGLCHAAHQACCGQRDQQHGEHQHLRRHQKHRNQEIPVGFPGLEKCIFETHKSSECISWYSNAIIAQKLDACSAFCWHFDDLDDFLQLKTSSGTPDGPAGAQNDGRGSGATSQFGA